MNKSLLYNKSEVNLWEFTDEEWEKSDDSLFADHSEFDQEPLENNTTSAPLFGRKDVDSSKPGIGREDGGSMANDSNDSETESALISVPDHIESPPRRSKHNCSKRVLYPGQIVYGSGPLSKVNAKAPEVGQSSSSANLVSSRSAKSHENMV